MTQWKTAAWPGVKTFSIGAVAGVAPFLFMCIVPCLIQPDLKNPTIPTLALCLAGLLVGAITMILFVKDAAMETPKHTNKDIFFYALGIPALLIGMINSISKDLDLQSEKTKASEVINEQVAEKTTEGEANPLDANAILGGEAFNLHEWLGIGTAYAAGDADEISEPDSRQSTRSKLIRPKIKVKSDYRYLVSIAQFDSKSDPVLREKLKQYLGQTFNTAKYTPQNIQVYEIDGKYHIVYSEHSKSEEAEKAYKLLRINDPDVSPLVLKVPIKK